MITLDIPYFISKLSTCNIGSLGGGNPPKRPTKEEIVRMKIVAEEYYAKNIILAEWKPGEKLRFYQLKKNFNQKTNIDSAWTSVEPSQIFR